MLAGVELIAVVIGKLHGMIDEVVIKSVKVFVPDRNVWDRMPLADHHALKYLMNGTMGTGSGANDLHKVSIWSCTEYVQQ